MSSISSVVNSSGERICSYDVFLSFRGEDTRNSFTDHLYHRLIEAGIRTFIDNEGINKGGELNSEFRRAIKGSRASIVVLSTNYATSAWCLDELLLILDEKKERSHFVLPVFYHVDPTDVRNQKGSFAIEVKPSDSKWTERNVSRWERALAEVANMAGHVLSGPETSFLKEIVNAIYDELDLKKVGLPLNMIGVNTRCEKINSWLYSYRSDCQFFVIYGMGGSGKTTLARYIYNSNQKAFKSVSFVGDIGSRYARGNDLVDVQEQLLNDLARGKERTIPCVHLGTPLIEDALKTKKSLIVLDDIVGYSQLVDLIGTGEINAESRIIITTRENTDSWLDFSNRSHQTYPMGLLNVNESLRLLCHHAFGSEVFKAGFREVVLRAIQYCGGNPLALVVLGSSLRNNDVNFWASELRSIEGDIDSRIENVLIRSYESLPSNTVKQLFLHIACFFNGIDMDYAVKILDPDYSAKSRIKTLISRCLVSVSPNKKLMVHRLVQEMGKSIVRQESTLPAKRSRVWLNSESHKILRKGMGSETVEGLALDMKMLKDEIAFKPSQLKTDALNNMDNLKLLQLNFVELNGSYDNISEDLRWLCWLGFHLKTIPSNLFVGNVVAIDVSYSRLEAFEPPAVLQSLQILNLKDSHNLSKISNFSMIPHLETLILWNCFSLVHVCKTIGGLTRLDTLNMTGCKNLFNRKQINTLAASTSGGVVTEQPAFSFPFSLHRLFLNGCHLESTTSFPLSFSAHLYLQYLNLGNSQFESLPCFDRLENLRVLDLSFCSRLKYLIHLPNTLAEMYIYGCESLAIITFQSPRFTLQEFGYLGCINLYEVEGFFKLLPIADLDETELGHMKWLQEYQNRQVCLVGDDELTVGRSWYIQMLYEFDIMSTSLPDIWHPNMTPKYTSKSASLSFDVPPCPRNKRLKGVGVTFKYTLSGDDWVWFCKISTASGGVDLMYNPKVFGQPVAGEACIWLSYWPIGDKLKTGDTVHVSIVEIKGMKVHQCGVSLVYSDHQTMKNEMGWEEILGGDLSGFRLSNGMHYLCRRDFFGSLIPYGFTVLVGGTIDYREVRGWRKTGRPKHANQSFTEVKTIRCIINGPQLEDIYKIAEMSKPSTGDKPLVFTSNLTERGMKSATRSIRNFKPFFVIEDEQNERITNSAIEKGKQSSSSPSTYPCRRFSFQEIQAATRNFENDLILGRGGFGRVYKGQINSKDGGHFVAIKRWDYTSHLGEDEFRAEIYTLCKFRHRHLVPLVGYCDDTMEMILVYEYIPNGSLYDHLHELHTSLSWMTRLTIAIGVARGLEYLYDQEVVHRNIKSKNILLDKNWETVITGFGFSIINPTYEEDGDNGKGTIGYYDPEYMRTGRLTMKTDLFSFGVVLFELLSGKRPLNFKGGEDPQNLVRWAEECVKERKLDELVDSSIKEMISTESLQQLSEIAYRCVHNVPEERPTVTEIVASLEALQEKPNPPAKSSGKMGFARKIYNYFVPAKKPDSDLSESSSQKSPDKNKNKKHNE